MGDQGRQNQRKVVQGQNPEQPVYIKSFQVLSGVIGGRSLNQAFSHQKTAQDEKELHGNHAGEADKIYAEADGKINAGMADDHQQRAENSYQVKAGFSLILHDAPPQKNCY